MGTPTSVTGSTASDQAAAKERDAYLKSMSEAQPGSPAYEAAQGKLDKLMNASRNASGYERDAEYEAAFLGMASGGSGGNGKNNGTGSTPGSGSSSSKGGGNTAAGRPIQSGLKIQPLNLKGSIEPQYAKLQAEVVAENPILGLDPETKKLLAQQGHIASDMMSGILPEDVEARVATIAAARGSKTGMNMWSQSGRNAEARDLGLTSLDLMQRGADMSQKMVDSERSFKMQRFQLLEDARRLDLNAAEIKLERQKMDRSERMNRLNLAVSTVMQYHEQVYRYTSLKKSSQTNVDALSDDFDTLVASIRNLSSKKG